MTKFTQHFREYQAKYHTEHAPAHISVDWDVYTNNPDSPDETTRAVHIYTERLVLSSTCTNDANESYEFLYSDPDVMRLYGDGTTKTLDVIKAGRSKWHEKWKAKNPFSPFVVHTNEDDFVGSFMAVESTETESVEIAYASATKAQKKGYAQEYAGAGVFDWIPYVIDHEFNLPNGESLKNVMATAHPTNIGSIRILENTLGLQYYKTEEKFGNARNYYKMEIVEEIDDVVAADHLPNILIHPDEVTILRAQVAGLKEVIADQAHTIEQLTQENTVLLQGINPYHYQDSEESV